MIFGIFGKKKAPQSAMDALVRATYGENPPKRSADVAAAVDIAHTILLGGLVESKEVRSIATQLSAGPMPYSTHDLAISCAINIFRHAEGPRREALASIQVRSRLVLLAWIEEKKVAPLIARAFEDTLYKLFKDAPHSSQSPAGMLPPLENSAPSRSSTQGRGTISAHDEERGELWQPLEHEKSDPHAAAHRAVEFVIWQNNQLQMRKLDFEERIRNADDELLADAFVAAAIMAVRFHYSFGDDKEGVFIANCLGRLEGVADMELLTARWATMQAATSQVEGDILDSAMMSVCQYLKEGKKELPEHSLAAVLGY